MFSWGNGRYVAEKSWLVCATGFGVDALPWKSARSVCAGVTEGSRWLLFFVDAVLLCFASQSAQIAVDWLRQGLSKGSNVLRFCLCFASHPWQIALKLLHDGCDLKVRNCRTHCVFLGKRRLRCGEQLARVRDRLWRRRFAMEVGSICVRRCNWGFQVTFFSSLLMLCFCVLQVSLRRSQWTGCGKAYPRVVMSCDSACVLQVILGRSHWNCCMMDAFES